MDLNNNFYAACQADSNIGKIITEDIGVSEETNIQFTDDVQRISHDIGAPVVNNSFVHEASASASLATFMSRPVRIFDAIWSPNVQFPFSEVRPWEAFLSNPQVAQKTATFKLINGTLKLRIMVNGTPFHYGRLFVGVRPTINDNNNSTFGVYTNQELENYTVTGSGIPGPRNTTPLKVLYSQRPHVFVDPATNQSQIITWPFFSATNWIDLTQPDDPVRMGGLELWELSGLQHASNGTGGVTITIYAWMEDVTFAGLTVDSAFAQSSNNVKGKSVKKTKSSQPKSTTNSKSKVSITEASEGQMDTVALDNGDENEYGKDGMISAVATTVSQVGNMLSKVPIIGSYAKATSMVADKVANVARIFGFSRPAILTDTIFVRPSAVANLAACEGAEPVVKLSIDPKQELTVDPSTLNLSSVDELSINNLKRIESYYDQFFMNTLQPAGSFLYEVALHPQLSPNFISGPSGTVKVPTALSFLSAPFEHWTGTIKIRFQVVCSQFHRGRLLFVYDPTVSSIGSVNDTNNRFSYILDISQDRDIELAVKWNQQQGYKFVASLPFQQGIIDSNILGNEIALVPGSDNYTNGKICVYVLNQLTAPVDVANITINCFVSAGEDFQVRNPSSAFFREAAYAREDFARPQSGSTPTNGISMEENSPMINKSCVLNGHGPTSVVDDSLTYFGETITSLRTLMRRYAFHRAIRLEHPGNAITAVEYRFNNLPNGPGPEFRNSTQSDLTPIAGNTPYNICAMTPVRYIVSAFASYRGSLRYKLIISSNEPGGVIAEVVRSHELINTEVSDLVVLADANTNDGDTAQRALSLVCNGGSMGGAALTAGIVNPTLEYEIPYQSGIRFSQTTEEFAGTPEAYRNSYECHRVCFSTRHLNNDDHSFCESYSAVGEDFSCFFFIGAPLRLQSDALTVTT